MNSSKKKSDIASILDDLRHEDPRKRFNAVHDIREAATALGPARVKSDLISFLACILMLIQNLSMMKKISFSNSCLSSKTSQLFWEDPNKKNSCYLF